jgi:hypothetical protein
LTRPAIGYPSLSVHDDERNAMSEDSDRLGHLDDAAEENEPSSTADGPAAEGEYDPAQGSPDSGPHATRPDDAEKVADTGSESGPDD